MNTRERSSAGSLVLRGVVLSVLLASSPLVLAQSSSATLRGEVTLDAAPAGGAKVTATNTETGLTRSAQSDANGAYQLGGLPPGTYKIDVDAGGKTSTQNVTLQVGQTATLDLGVGGAPVESVTVTATHLYETKTSEVANYVSQRQIEILPQVSRNFLAFADTVPGVQFKTNGDGSTEFRSGAQAANGVNVFIDGVGQKNYVLRGGVSGQATSRGNPFPQLGIAEYKVITSNYKAEFDQLSSAAIVAVTRSGTNEFEAEAFWDRTSENWRASDPNEARAGRKAQSEQEQYGASFGGPIVRDLMHFYLTYERKTFESPQTVTLGQGVTVDQVPQLANIIGVTSTPFDEDLFFGKVDWAPGDAHLFELTAKVREESEIQGVGGQSAPEHGSSKDNDDKRLDLRYQFSAGSFLNDAHLTYEDASFNPRPLQIAPGIRYTTSNKDDLIIALGGGEDFQDKGQRGWGVQDDFTYTGIASHALKTGIKLKRVEVNSFEQQPYNAQFSFDVTNSITTPFYVRFGAPLPGLARNVESTNKQFGLYAQDDWDVNDRLQLNLGVRWDYEETPSYLDYRTPADVLAGIGSQTPGAPVGQTFRQTLALGGIDIDRFISTGNNRDAFKDAIQPRLGFSYDLTEDERVVLFGGAGRAYDRNVFDYLALEASKGTFPSYERFFDSPGHPCTPGDALCIPFDPAFLQDQSRLQALVAANPSLGREINLIDNNLKTPYSDQFTLGVRDRLFFWNNDWNTSLAFSRVVSKDGILFLLGNRYPDGSFFAPGTTWGTQFGGSGVPGLGTLILITNGLETQANQVLLSLEKPYSSESGWSATVAYTFSDAQENRGNIASSDEHYLLDYPNVARYGWHESTGVPRHRLVSTASWDGPWGVTVAGKMTLSSPLNREAVNCYNAPDTDHCFFQFVKSSATIGFKQVDMTLAKAFEAWGGTKLNVRADVLNVFNYVNADGYDNFRGNPGAPNPNFANVTSYLQPTRTFKLSFSVNWK
jgi:outer membrane receptor protein involved in Fe transport